MARSKIDIDQINWSEISSGSLAGPASFVGVNASNELVLAAASNYVSAGGGGGISFDGSTANGVLTYKDSDEATVESGLTFDGSTLLASADDVRIRLNGDIDSHPGLELAENGTRKWIVYNNYANDNLTFKTNSNIRMTIAQTGIVGFTEGFEVGSDAAGDILYHNGTSYVRLPKGSADQVLTMNDGATAPNWEDASGGSNTIIVTERGTGYMGYPHRKYVHKYAGGSSTYESSREWSHYSSGWGNSQATSIDVTPADSLVYWACWVAPVACSVTSATIQLTSTVSQNTYASILSADMSSADDSASNVTWLEMKKATSSGNTSSRAHKISLSSLNNNTLAAGDMIAIAFDGNTTGNTGWSAQTIHFVATIYITPS